MIERIEIVGRHMPVDEKLHKYIWKKIGNTDKYIPRQARPSAHVSVVASEDNAADKKRFGFEVTLYLPTAPIHVHEYGTNIYSAVDIAEDRLKAQIIKYKETHNTKDGTDA